MRALTGEILPDVDRTEKKKLVATTKTRMGTEAFHMIDWTNWTSNKEGIRYVARASRRSNETGKIRSINVTEENEKEKIARRMIIGDVVDLAMIETMETVRRLVEKPASQIQARKTALEVTNITIQTTIIRMIQEGYQVNSNGERILARKEEPETIARK